MLSFNVVHHTKHLSAWAHFWGTSKTFLPSCCIVSRYIIICHMSLLDTYSNKTFHWFTAKLLWEHLCASQEEVQAGQTQSGLCQLTNYPLAQNQLSSPLQVNSRFDALHDVNMQLLSVTAVSVPSGFLTVMSTYVKTVLVAAYRDFFNEMQGPGWQRLISMLWFESTCWSSCESQAAVWVQPRFPLFSAVWKYFSGAEQYLTVTVMRTRSGQRAA